MRTERADISQVLEQMRAVREQLQGSSVISNQSGESREIFGVGLKGLLNGVQKTSATENNSSGFVGALKGALDSVNNLQQESMSLSQAYELGEPGVDLTRVMISSQKASLSFQAAMQVRNKIVTAYQEIMNMPI